MSEEKEDEEEEEDMYFFQTVMTITILQQNINIEPGWQKTLRSTMLATQPKSIQILNYHKN